MASPWLHRSSILLAAATFLSLFTGTAVTSNAERPYYALGQYHWWLGLVVAALTVAVAVWIQNTDDRLWLRRLGWGAVGTLALQAWLGMQPMPQAPSVRIAHASVAQLFFATALVIAAGTASAWKTAPKRVQGPRALLRMAQITPAVVALQVALGILFRHGALGVGPHLTVAFLAALFILGLALTVIHGTEHRPLSIAARVLITIASVQVFVGMTLFIVESMEIDPSVIILLTLIHSATGALTLAATVVMAVLVGRWVYISN